MRYDRGVVILEALATAEGVAARIRFALASRAEVREHYLAADATLFTGAIRHEAFGLVPLEAMAAGCPVVSTGVGARANTATTALTVRACRRTMPRRSPRRLGAWRRSRIRAIAWWRVACAYAVMLLFLDPACSLKSPSTPDHCH